MAKPRAPHVPPSFFDIFSGGEAPSIEAASHVLATLAQTVRDNPRWIVETAGDQLVVVKNFSFDSQRLAFSLKADAASLDIVMTIDASGWISIAGHRDGAEIFRAWLDRPYEEFELWPADVAVPSPRTGEAPGRIGKRGTWINLLAGAWPQLAAFANAHGIVAAIDEDSHLNNPPLNLE